MRRTEVKDSPIFLKSILNPMHKPGWIPYLRHGETNLKLRWIPYPGWFFCRVPSLAWFGAIPPLREEERRILLSLNPFLPYGGWKEEEETDHKRPFAVFGIPFWLIVISLSSFLLRPMRNLLIFLGIKKQTEREQKITPLFSCCCWVIIICALGLIIAAKREKVKSNDVSKRGRIH